MASIINATTTNGLVTSADNSGIIELQSNGTKVAVLSSGNSTSVGTQALNGNTAAFNTAVGYQAKFTGTGGYNTCFGAGAGSAFSTGAENTLVGYYAGGALTTGNKNLFIGGAQGNGSGGLITTGSSNTVIGSFSGNQGGLDIRTASNYIVLSDGDGNPRLVFNASGYPFIYNMNSGAGTNAMKFNTSTGAVTYDTSSARYKDNIRDSVYGLNAVMQLRSTQFEYKDDGRSDVGLIAEEVQPIIPELVAINKEGQADSVSYDRMVSVLVKAIQELNAKVDAQAAEIQALKGVA